MINADVVLAGLDGILEVPRTDQATHLSILRLRAKRLRDQIDSQAIEDEPWEYIAHVTEPTSQPFRGTINAWDPVPPPLPATHRRRKAGPWEPVTEPHDADATLHGSLS